MGLASSRWWFQAIENSKPARARITNGTVLKRGAGVGRWLPNDFATFVVFRGNEQKVLSYKPGCFVYNHRIVRKIDTLFEIRKGWVHSKWWYEMGNCVKWHRMCGTTFVFAVWESPHWFELELELFLFYWHDLYCLVWLTGTSLSSIYCYGKPTVMKPVQLYVDIKLSKMCNLLSLHGNFAALKNYHLTCRSVSKVGSLWFDRDMHVYNVNTCQK